MRTSAHADRLFTVLGVRCVPTPDKARKVLLNRLGLILPWRLRYIEEVEKCSHDSP
jgi:hypothetical protein